MPRGQVSELGTEHVNQNGYISVKTIAGWRLKHHLVAESLLGRPLKHDELVSFIDNDRTNFSLDNIVVHPQGEMKYVRRKHWLEGLLEDYNKQYYELTGKIFHFEISAHE